MNVAGRRAFLPLLATLAVFTGCSEPTQPNGMAVEPENVNFSASESGTLAPIATFNQRPNITIAWAKKWIGPAGGRLEIQGFAVDVPAGAVSKSTLFSIHLPVDPSGSERVMARFGPHGATFSSAVTIEFPYLGTSIFADPAATVVWWNPDANAWVDVGGTVTETGRLRTTTTHFSEYGTSDGRGGVLTASGG
ncbi:hypothetical protein BH23GEM8_BH23GEM8_19260 [soil metagenome]